MNLIHHTSKLTQASAPGAQGSVPSGAVIRPPAAAMEPGAKPGMDLLARLPSSHRAPAFDETDARFFRESVALRDQQEGPRIGDFVRYPDGALHRLAIDSGERGFQTMEPGRGAFYDSGSGHLFFSCGSPSLTPFVKAQNLARSEETREGEVWTFHHQESVPGGRVNAMVPCRVYAYSPDRSD